MHKLEFVLRRIGTSIFVLIGVTVITFLIARVWFLERFRQNTWVFVTGERDICRADTEHAARLFAHKDIPHSLHVWGHGSEHDWPEWVKMAAAYLP